MKVVVEGGIADREQAWALVGDTDHLHRLAGNPPLVMDISNDQYGYPEVRGTIIGPGPIRHRFIEVESRWVRGQFFRHVREITGPLLRRAVYSARLEPDGAGVRPIIEIEMEAANSLVTAAVAPLTRRGAQVWKRALMALPPPGEPGAIAPQRSLPRDVQLAMGRWREQTGAEEIIDHCERWLQYARPSALREMRPFALADRWQADRRRVLMAFLEGVSAGAVEMFWSIRCPRCRAGVDRADTLSNLADQADCASCRLHFGADLDRNVEAMFAAHVSVRPPAGEAFCTLYPAGRPDVLAMITLPPGADDPVDLQLPPGRWFLGAGGEQADLEISTGEEGADSLEWAVGDTRTAVSLRSGAVRLALSNKTAGRARVTLAGTAQVTDGVPAAYIATMPEYRRRFGPAVLAPDVRIGVRAMAFLFTDLTGSAALYHELGDADAFRLVHDHFNLLREIVDDCGGVTVKTIGDAIMAAFYAPEASVAAGLRMLKEYPDWIATRGLAQPPGLRLGIHSGSAMAVHTDTAGLDYFGGTVNMASRLEGLAGAGELVLSAAVHDDSTVQQQLTAWGGPVERFRAEVKGLPGALCLYRLRVTS